MRRSIPMWPVLLSIVCCSALTVSADDGTPELVIVQPVEVDGQVVYLDSSSGEILDEPGDLLDEPLETAFAQCAQNEKISCVNSCIRLGHPVGPPRGVWELVAVGCARAYEIPNDWYTSSCKCYWADSGPTTVPGIPCVLCQ